MTTMVEKCAEKRSNLKKRYHSVLENKKSFEFHAWALFTSFDDQNFFGSIVRFNAKSSIKKYFTKI